jgi:hypothetical protein
MTAHTFPTFASGRRLRTFMTEAVESQRPWTEEERRELRDLLRHIDESHSLALSHIEEAQDAIAQRSLPMWVYVLIALALLCGWCLGRLWN